MDAASEYETPPPEAAERLQQLGEGLEDSLGGPGEDQPADGGHDHAGSVRRFEHRGHEVEIVTHYHVHIDGEPWEQDLQVMDDGSVHYHGLPQYGVPSAVELLRGVIDAAYAVPDVVRDAARDDC